ncbi:radical SAM/SPASM domain-containing protein [Desulfobacterium sp. N47]|uniref:radical SAM protein n=1 Tax=Desulfobacterium sp. N47 TaxID=3115210 RepID=UPI003CBCB505
MSYLKEVLPKIIRYRLARKKIIPCGLPINLTFSVTNKCQSRCRTCSIWAIYEKHPEKKNEELTIDEIEKIFRSMGHIYIFNISGGEPFLRPDIAEIIKLACKYLSPGIIHIPTNAIDFELVGNKTRQIIDFLKSDFPKTHLTVKPSLDHIGDKHDNIRGVKGNFEKVMTLFNRLKAMQPDFPNFHAELGTVISRWNVSDIEEIAAFVTSLAADSYRNEIAEQRFEMFNTKNSITPEAEDYEKAIKYFVSHIRANMKNRLFFLRLTNAFRLVYYSLAVQILKEKRQVIPCYAGISNAHLSPYGDVWACCTLAYEKSMGNLRDYNYSFKDLWNSIQADTVRNDIYSGTCSCPLANQTYSNMLMHGPSLVKVLHEMIK